MKIINLSDFEPEWCWLKDYLLNTWHFDTRPNTLNLSDYNARKWLGLNIKWSESAGENTAVVEFVALY